MELKGALFFVVMGLLCALGAGHNKGRQHKLYTEREDPEDVQIEPEIKIAASLSHAMLQQLTDAVRLLLPLKDQVSVQQNKIDAIYNMTFDTNQYLVSSKKEDTEVKVMREEIARMARKAGDVDTECSESLEHCRQNTKNALAELRFRCDSEMTAAEKKWQEKIQELSLQKGGQMSVMQQDCETMTIQLQQECFSKMMALSKEADATIEGLKAHNLRLQAQLDELHSRMGQQCAPERTDFEYQGNVAKSAKGIDLDKPKPTSNNNTECEGYADMGMPVPPASNENGMNVGNNKQYIIGERKVTWNEANKICRAKGMWLLTQETERDKHLLNVHIQKIVGTSPATFWMSARKEEGETWFMWQCFTTNQRPWRHSQNPKMDQRCAYVTFQRGGKGVWSDDTCEATHRYICQKNVF